MSESMRIPLSGRKHPDLFALVDKEDYERVSRFRWYAHEDGRTHYARRTIRHNNRGRITYSHVLMHRFILDAAKGVKVDHVNGNGLDNRKANLRSATVSQNGGNRRTNVTSPHEYKGIGFSKRNGRWQAQIGWQGKPLWLGYHDSPEDAARAYDAKARELFGEYARLNFPG